MKQMQKKMREFNVFTRFLLITVCCCLGTSMYAPPPPLVSTQDIMVQNISPEEEVMFDLIIWMKERSLDLSWYSSSAWMEGSKLAKEATGKAVEAFFDAHSSFKSKKVDIINDAIFFIKKTDTGRITKDVGSGTEWPFNELTHEEPNPNDPSKMRRGRVLYRKFIALQCMEQGSVDYETIANIVSENVKNKDLGLKPLTVYKDEQLESLYQKYITYVIQKEVDAINLESETRMKTRAAKQAAEEQKEIIAATKKRRELAAQKSSEKPEVVEGVKPEKLKERLQIMQESLKEQANKAEAAEQTLLKFYWDQWQQSINRKQEAEQEEEMTISGFVGQTIALAIVKHSENTANVQSGFSADQSGALARKNMNGAVQALKEGNPTFDQVSVVLANTIPTSIVLKSNPEIQNFILLRNFLVWMHLRFGSASAAGLENKKRVKEYVQVHSDLLKELIVKGIITIAGMPEGTVAVAGQPLSPEEIAAVVRLLTSLYEKGPEVVKAIVDDALDPKVTKPVIAGMSPDASGVVKAALQGARVLLDNVEAAGTVGGTGLPGGPVVAVVGNQLLLASQGETEELKALTQGVTKLTAQQEKQALHGVAQTLLGESGAAQLAIAAGGTSSSLKDAYANLIEQFEQGGTQGEESQSPSVVVSSESSPSISWLGEEAFEQEEVREAKIHPVFAADVARVGMDVAREILARGYENPNDQDVENALGVLQKNDPAKVEFFDNLIGRIQRNSHEMAYLIGYVQNCIWQLKKQQADKASTQGVNKMKELAAANEKVKRMIEVLHVAASVKPSMIQYSSKVAGVSRG